MIQIETEGTTPTNITKGIRNSGIVQHNYSTIMLILSNEKQANLGQPSLGVSWVDKHEISTLLIIILFIK
ncbi:hypothetical protein EB796_021162 [Bugula neritina]|uniref:Uncharacterized protein n=1 Tax=Bugula neritina TaxID=10212 RepID=A0A7J7J3U8_BUGNE|nr:hypothetical protein EB796_021162 [Bugula neritina]